MYVLSLLQLKIFFDRLRHSSSLSLLMILIQVCYFRISYLSQFHLYIIFNSDKFDINNDRFIELTTKITKLKSFYFLKIKLRQHDFLRSKSIIHSKF